jgi:DNA-binding IclR family transcriptional regulator
MAKLSQANRRPSYKAPAISKAFMVLKTVAEASQPLGIVKLAERLGFSKSTTHGIVHALLREGALTKGQGSRHLYLGPTLADLVFSTWHPADVAKQAQPIINDIRDRINETVFFGTRIRHRVTINAIAEAPKSLKLSASVGTTLPLLAAAVGKAFLAHASIDQVERIIDKEGLPCFTQHSIVDKDTYLAELEQVRRQGYALDKEEYIAGIRAVAVALNNIRGLPMALWVVGISGDLGREKIRAIATLISQAAETMQDSIDRQALLPSPKPVTPTKRVDNDQKTVNVHPNKHTRRLPCKD